MALNIALITEKYPPDPGGLAASAWRLARLLSQSGYIVHVFSPHVPAGSISGIGEERSLLKEGIWLHRFAAHRRVDDTLADWFDCLSNVQREIPGGFDLLHGYFLPQAGFLAAYAGRYFGLPAVVSARGNDLDRAVFDPGKAAHILYALEHASSVTANTQDLARKARSLAPGQSVVLIHNGVDANLFKPQPLDPEIRQRLGLDDRPVVGFVGEARLKKGLAPLCLAVEQVSIQMPVSLLLVGGVRSGEDGDLVKIFQKQNPSLPLVIVPPVPYQDLPAYYSLVDVLALPSLRDGLPNALLEGMACECAVVATAVGGIPEAVQDGLTGRLVPPGDPDALAGAIRELLERPNLRRRLGQNARATAVKYFPLEMELEANLALYRNLLGSKFRNVEQDQRSES